MMKAAALVALIWGLALPAFSQDRVALVIGNSSYKNSPLTNPVNDASDVGAALKGFGFEVILKTDADLRDFESSLSDFKSHLKGKSIALFYFAGHGVQFEGENYLVPVRVDIQDSVDLRTKGLAMSKVIGVITASGAKTGLIFLDACRDNPFPGSSRSGVRGLVPIVSPKNLETLIAYATGPGDTAQDGKGRNGIFTAAFLKNLPTPGATLQEIMTNVKLDVKTQTNGLQQPRVDDGLTAPFLFSDPAELASMSKTQAARAQAELAALDAQLAELEARIAASKNASETQKLQVEQKRQQALQAAKKLEADNLAAEAKRQAEASTQAQQAAYQHQAAAQAAQAKQNELGNLAAARRVELEKLAQAGDSDNPDVLIETVERLDAVLREVDGQYAKALEKSLLITNAIWDMQRVAIGKEEPDIVESDAEFATRQKQEYTALEAKRQADLTKIREDADAPRLSQTVTIRNQFETTLNTLQTKVWTLVGSSVLLTVGPFDRNTKVWPFTVASLDSAVPMQPVALTAELGTLPDPATAIRGLNDAVKANALGAEIDWGLRRQPEKNRYVVEVRAVRIRNLTNNEVIAINTIPKRSAYFGIGQHSHPSPAVATLVVTTSPVDGVALVYVDGNKLGVTPLNVSLAEGTVNLELRWTDNYPLYFKGKVSLSEGETTNVNASKPPIAIGGMGPAGGIVFFDKGNNSSGWRYLEAAPEDTAKGIKWFNGLYPNVATKAAIGTGKSNSDAIIAAQGVGRYAATACHDLNLGGFSDWFLPSKDELNQLYIVLSNVASSNLVKDWYWSSSQGDANFAWAQHLGGGLQDYFGVKSVSYRVRAVRAF